MRTNSPPPLTPGPVCLPRRPITLTEEQHQFLMAALIDYNRIRGSLLSLEAREIGLRLAPQEAT